MYTTPETRNQCAVLSPLSQASFFCVSALLAVHLEPVAEAAGNELASRQGLWAVLCDVPQLPLLSIPEGILGLGARMKEDPEAFLSGLGVSSELLPF